MSNPFDETVDDSYNPFAAGYNDQDAAPAPTQNNTYNQSYEPPQDTYQAPQNTYNQSNPPQNQQSYDTSNPYGAPRSQSTKQSGTAITKVMNAVGVNADYVDPVTGVPISQADLDRREEALNRREQAIAGKETALANGTLERPVNPKNFPPFLKWWSYHPDEDLPQNAVKMAKLIFYVFGATGIVYLINFIGCLCCLNSGAAARVSSPATKIVLSTIFLFVFWPISYELCYFVLYRSLVQQKAMRYFCFLGTYAIWILILALNVIGLDDGGSVGFIQMIDLFSAESGKFVAVIALIFCIVACGDIAIMVYTYILCIRFYKSEGLTQKAFSEASQFAAQKARENPDAIMEVARDNPDLVYGAASHAANYA
ncbi:hypothetical protein M9Y10_025545 [Tritrichomonas musculus]|uniref:Secretory carrier membrane protein n=1 Tax=Tritrichomonas musculus TaxID=1915356 RepID=A0ABR2H8Z1_9EUKA